MWEPRGLSVEEMHATRLSMAEEAVVFGEPLIFMMPISGLNIDYDQLHDGATP